MVGMSVGYDATPLYKKIFGPKKFSGRISLLPYTPYTPYTFLI